RVRPQGVVPGPHTPQGVVIREPARSHAVRHIILAQLIVADPDVAQDAVSLLVNRGNELTERLGKLSDSFFQQLGSDRINADAQLLQTRQNRSRFVDAFRQGNLHTPVIEDRFQRVGRYGIDGIRTDKLVYVHRIGIGRVFGAGAGP